MSLTLVPAYGRDYKSKAAVLKDWEEGKDFQIQTIGRPYDGKYTSIRDGHKTVNIRYDKMRKICTITA